MRLVVEELIPVAFHNTEQYANNRIEAITDASRLDSDQCAAFKRVRTASVIIRGHALMQNIRRGHL